MFRIVKTKLLVALGVLSTVSVAGTVAWLVSDSTKHEADCALTGVDASASDAATSTLTQLSEPVDDRPMCVIGTTADGVKVSVIFAAGTDPKYIGRVMWQFSNSVAGNQEPWYNVSGNARWSRTAQQTNTGNPGDPVRLTYSYVPDGTTIPNAGFGGGPSNLNAQMNTKFGGSTWKTKLTAAMERWGQVAGLVYTQENNDDGVEINASGSAGSTGVRGDCRIAGKALDGQSGVLAYNYYPNSGDMVIDTDENWQSPTNDYRFLRNTLGHEHGHGLGFGHSVPCDGTKLMEPFLNTNFDLVQLDDILAGNWYYGDRFENNDTSGTATDLGSLGVGVHPTNQVSLDKTADVDFYKFQVPSNAKINVTLTPTGATYTIGNQSSGCNGTTASYNTLNRQNLGFEVRDTNGTTVLTTVNTNGAGQGETLTNFQLNGSGPFFIRVFGSGTNDVQMYNFSIEVQSSPVVSGTVTLEDLTGALTDQVLTVQLLNPGTSTVVATYNPVPAANGVYSFTSTLTGTYDITCRGQTWLTAKRTNVNITSGGATGQNFTLKNGDVNGDNSVGIPDFLALRAAFGSSPGSGNWNANADLNKDNTVNANDFLIIRKNFGQSGA